MKLQDRNYRLLQYLNVNTRVSYLARIRNPNPKCLMRTKLGSPALTRKRSRKNECHSERSEAESKNPGQTVEKPLS
jgi:molybdopterin-containing oxidoreductase family iron-sulfur binding subunit